MWVRSGPRGPAHPDTRTDCRRGCHRDVRCWMWLISRACARVLREKNNERSVEDCRLGARVYREHEGRGHRFGLRVYSRREEAHTIVGEKKFVEGEGEKIEVIARIHRATAAEDERLTVRVTRCAPGLLRALVPHVPTCPRRNTSSGGRLSMGSEPRPTLTKQC